MDTSKKIELLSTQQVAQLLKVGRSTVYNLRARGLLKPIYIGRCVRFRLQDVEALLKELQQPQNDLEPFQNGR